MSCLPDEVVAWIEDVVNGAVVGTRRMPGGTRKQAWFVDVERSSGAVEELFLRFDPADPAETGDPWTLHREARVYLALQDTEVTVPRVLGVHPVRQAMLAERVEGDTWFSRITDPDEALATARDFVRNLSALHRVDPATLDLPGFPPSTTIPELVHHELRELEAVIVSRGGEPEPELRLTLDWLRDHVPDHDGPVVLVQGDTGPGNFMYSDGRVVAVVDWELAHLGDPMDDIAWLSLRAAQEPFTHLPDRLREYEDLSGHAVDDDRVRYYRVMAEAKLMVMAHGSVPADAGGDLGNRLIYSMLHRRLWLEAMADAFGLVPPTAEEPPARGSTDVDVLYEDVLRELRDVVLPAVTEPIVRQRVKGLARAVKYLAAVGHDGAYYDECELDDLTSLLGERPRSVSAGRAALRDAVRARTLTDVDYLTYLNRRAARDNELLRPASGVLADRHWPPLR